MISQKTYYLHGILSFLLTIGFVCCNDDNTDPVTIRHLEGNTISFVYPDNDSKFTFEICGGDGVFTVKSGDDAIISVEMLSAVEFTLQPVGLGETTLTITDNSQNTLVINIKVDYARSTILIKGHDISISADNLTEIEKKAVEEQQLARIPVKAGGGYVFVFSGPSGLSGEVTIYPVTFGSEGIETTFEVREVPLEYSSLSSMGYEIDINNEKRFFFIREYTSLKKSWIAVPTALTEDVTDKVLKDYPMAENVCVYTSQVLDYR